MSLAFFPASHSAPTVSTPVTEQDSSLKDSSSSIMDNVVGGRYEDVQSFVEKRDEILGALDGTKSVLEDLRSFNKDSWTVRYPRFHSTTPSPTDTPPSKRRPTVRHSLSFADDPVKEHDVQISIGERTAGRMRRNLTLAAIPQVEDSEEASEKAPSTSQLIVDEPEAHSESDRQLEPESDEGLIPPSDLQILRLDLKLGPHGVSAHSATGLVSQLERASIANLIDERISQSLTHLDKLRTRVEDTSSKVLVTGDLNAGKSTFVNALLGKEILPVDQQPCTMMFCEVRDAGENDGVEEAHIVNEGATYTRDDESTFTRAPLSQLEQIVPESDAQHILKLYIKDARPVDASLLNNGVVDISLIDAPGLNRDSLQTTKVFSRQEEIDVVVFVVSAENHFTLSAKEFLFTASNEKTHIFVVVNKYDTIRDKERCRRQILDQVKKLSPQTSCDRDDLVHFVDSQSALARAVHPDDPQPKSSVPHEKFENMEACLRSFVLNKRVRTKLAPAMTFMKNIIDDVELLVAANRINAQEELQRAKERIDHTRPVLEKMKKGRQDLEDGLRSEEDDTVTEAQRNAEALLTLALDRIGRGDVAVTPELVRAPSSKQPKNVPSLPPYPGIFHIFDYAKSVRRVLLQSLDLAVSLSEDSARVITADGVEKVFALAEKYLPDGTDRNRRVFVPEAMFSARNKGRLGRPGQAVVAGGVHGLGIGLAQRQDLLETSFLDIININHHVSKVLGSDDADDEDGSEGYTAWGIVSLGLGAVTMVGGKAVGVRGVIEGLAQIGDIFGNERSRRWAAPLLGIVTLGAAAYLIMEIPKGVPRSVGRQIKASLAANETYGPSNSSSVSLVTRQPGFVEAHMERIAKETRKVMRLAAWDSKEKFRIAFEERGKEVKDAEASEARSSKALQWFDEVDLRTEAVRTKASLTSTY